MDLLKDPQNDRVIKITPPPQKPLSKSLLFPANLKGKPDCQILENHLSYQGRILKQDLRRILNQTINILTVAQLIMASIAYNYCWRYPRVIIFFRWQYYDLMNILRIGGSVGEQKYLFIGDYVDRGQFSVQVLCLLYSLKINNGKSIFLLRGNHQCKQLTTYFNFRNECLSKYDQQIYQLFIDSFKNLPLAAVINNKFLCIHGGISPQLQQVFFFKRFKLLTKFRDSGRFLRRAFFVIFYGLIRQSRITILLINKIMLETALMFTVIMLLKKFYPNTIFQPLQEPIRQSCRGSRFTTGISRNSLNPELLLDVPQPGCNLQDRSFQDYQNNLIKIEQYRQSKHPYILPNFLDVFTWTMPFVIQKVTQMLYNIIKQSQELQEEQYQKAIEKNKKDTIKTKVRFIGKLLVLQKKLRQQSQKIIAPTIIIERKQQNLNIISDHFQNIRQKDIINQKMPQQQ